MYSQNLNLFFIDDEKIILEGLQKLINYEELGFSICGTAENGRDALPLILDRRPDIVITDLKMPFVDGITLANELAKTAPDILVIVVTGYDEFEYAKAAVHAGVFDFLLKPVSPAELKDALLRAADKIRSRKYNYPFELEDSMISAVMRDDFSGALNFLDLIFDDFHKHRISQDTARKICEKLVTELDICFSKYMGGNITQSKIQIPPEATLPEMHTLLTDYLNSVLLSEDTSSSDILVEQIKRYLASHLQENITLKVLENEFFFNASYISRIFKRKTGENYNEYLLKLRIERAKELLVTTNRSIIQISDATGFGNSKYFSRIFKSMTGMTPVNYRMVYRERG